jgi:RES domain
VAEVAIPQSELRLRNTCRLIPTRYPSAGILDAIARPEDLEAIIELESWSNDRISSELGVLHRLPREEWVTGRPFASVIMAAFCHPRPGGGRFNGPERGAWYASFTLETAHAEVIYHRTAELAEIGVFETHMQHRLYAADFRASFHDLRAPNAAYRRYYSPASYTAPQRLARHLVAAGSNGIVYRSVRDAKGFCLACFRPKLVENVRERGYYEYRWHGTPVPTVHRLPSVG